MNSKAQRKWSFVRPTRSVVWRWIEALGIVVVSHGLLFLLIGVKEEAPQTVNNSSTGTTLLSGQSLSPAEVRRMQRWMVLHDPASFADPGHAAGVSRILPDVLHHEVTAKEPVPGNVLPPAEGRPVRFSVEAPKPVLAMPFAKVGEPVPYQAQIRDSAGREVRIPLPVDHGTAGVTGPTVLRIVRRQEMALAMTERSCGVPLLDARAQGAILRSLPEAAEGERIIVNWPAENGGAK